MLNVDARENPFFPSKTADTLPITSNTNTSFEPLKRATITLPNSARVIEKVTIHYKNLDGSIDNKSIALGQSIDWHLPLFISQSYNNEMNTNPPKKAKKTKKFIPLASYKFITFSYADQKMYIATQDKLIRSFMLPTPHRIILDFKRDADFRSYEKKVDAKPFAKIRMGNHKGYYRVVIELDGQYHYKKRLVSDGLELSCY